MRAKLVEHTLQRVRQGSIVWFAQIGLPREVITLQASVPPRPAPVPLAPVEKQVKFLVPVEAERVDNPASLPFSAGIDPAHPEFGRPGD